MSGFDLLPAIDVRDGRVVRLRQGDYAHETRYDDEPLALAQRYARMGARWLHLVDLDAARTGGYTLLPLLAAMKRTTGLRVQTGGGVRGEADVEALLAGGADRVVIGSLAVRAPEIVERCLQRFGPERITVALDAREVGGEWRLPAAGWTEDTGVRFDDLLPRYADAGLTHALCTDIGRDGMLAGPNLALYRSVRRQAPTVRLQASGGVRDVGDVIGARGAGCAGVVLGRALLEGRLDLVEGLREERPC